MVESTLQDIALFALFNGRNVRALSQVSGLPPSAVMLAISSAASDFGGLLMLDQAGAALSPQQAARLELFREVVREPSFPQDPAPASSLLQSPPSALPSPTGERAWRAGPSASNGPGPAA